MRFPKYPPLDDATKIAVLPAEPVETRDLPALTAEHFWTVCKPGVPPVTCRYLTMAPQGIACAKGTDLGKGIDRLHAEGQMRAQGDNCEGRTGAIPPEEWVNRSLSS